MKKSSLPNVYPKMKTVAVSFVCLFYILNTATAKNDHGKLELEPKVRFVVMEIIKDEKFNLSKATTTTIEKKIQKNTLVKIPNFSQYDLFSNQESSANNLTVLFDLEENYKKTVGEVSSLSQNKITSNTNISLSTFAEETSSNSITTTSIYQRSNLKLRSSLNRYFAIGFLVDKKTSAAFVSNVIYTQSEKVGPMKLKAKLNSLSITVFF